MRRRDNRVAINLPVEVISGDQSLRSVTQDVSAHGMFVRLSPPLPAGAPVQIILALSDQELVLTGEVVHSLPEDEAGTLGRFPGIGVEFRDPDDPARPAISEALDSLLDHHAQRQPAAAELRIVVADPQTRLLERLSTALDTAGFSVATATNGMEALGACLSRTPDVVLLEREMPVVDGLQVLRELGRHPQLAGVPVMMMSADATDLVRLQALQLGAMDFIPKPFTVLEVILRARRWARARQRDPERVVLRGTLSELGLPSLLTMFEQERKSGQLSVTHDHAVAWIDFVEGKIVRARSSEINAGEIDAGTRSVIMAVLDWKEGYFELSSGTPVEDQPEIDSTVTHLLLEHARLRDEAQRAP